MDADGSHQPEQLHRLLDALLRRRPGDRLALGAGRLGRELAAAPRGALARRQPLRPAAARHRGPATPPPASGCSGAARWRRSTWPRSSPRATSSRPTWSPAACAPGCTVREVPIEFVERVRGDSKMSGAVATESLRRITRWGLRERRDQVRRALRRQAADGPRVASRARAGCSSSCSSCVPLVEIYVIIQVGQVIGAVVDDPAAGPRQHPRRLADQARGRPRLAGAARGARQRPDAGQGARRRRADPGRRHADADARASSPTPSAILLILPFTRPLFRRLLTARGQPAGWSCSAHRADGPGTHDAPVLTLTGRWSGARSSTSSSSRPGSGRGLALLLRWRGAGAPGRSRRRAAARGAP